MTDSRSEGVFPGKAGMLEKLEYKGLASTPMLDAESGSIHGTVDGIDGFAGYGSDSPEGVERAFRDAVDDYIDGCEVSGVRPGPKGPADRLPKTRSPWSRGGRPGHPGRRFSTVLSRGAPDLSPQPRGSSHW